MKSLLITLAILSCLLNIYANDWTDNQIVNAIYYAEGGSKAVKPYGILSVPCETKEECRRICLNTIRNQRVRHAQHSCGLTYLECLAKRYAPVGVTNDPTNLNKNWLKNVLYYLNKGEQSL